MPTAKPRRVLGYARVSSIEQAAGTSLEAQQETIRAYAAGRGFPKPTLFVEAESGIGEKLERRDRVLALMRDVRAGDLVLVDKIDRLSRDPEFTYRSVREIKAAGARIYFIGDSCDPDTEDGDSMLGMRIFIAREEHKRIKSRTVGARYRLQREGYFSTGQPPHGYRRQESDAPTVRNTLVAVPEQAEQVRTLFARYVAGESIRTAAKAVGLGGHAAHTALRNRAYLGQVQVPASSPGRGDGEWIKAKHEPLIDRDLFERARARLEENRIGGSRPHGDAVGTSDWILRDVAHCASCGAKMGSGYNMRGGERIGIYTCPRKCQSRGVRQFTPHRVPVAEIEATAVEDIEARLASIRSFLAKPHEESKVRPKLTDVVGKRASLTKRRARTLEQHREGFIESDELRKVLTDVDAQIAKLDAVDVAAAKPSPLADAKVRQAMLAEVEELERALSGLSGAEMRRVVNVLVERVGLAKEKPPVWTWRTAEAVKERLDVVRDALVTGLGRAPTRAEDMAANFRAIERAPVRRPQPAKR